MSPISQPLLKKKKNILYIYIYIYSQFYCPTTFISYDLSQACITIRGGKWAGLGEFGVGI